MVPIGTPWSDEERERLAMLLERGHSRRECAEAIGRPVGSVKAAMMRLGLKSRVAGGDPATWARTRPVAAEPDVRGTEPVVPVRASVAPPRDDVRRLVDLCKTRGRSLRDVCDALDLSPRAAEGLLEQARSAGYAVDVAGDTVAWHNRVGAEYRPDVVSTLKATTGNRFRLGVCSDLHFGSKYCMREQLADYARAAYAQGVRTFVVSGDILDGCYRHGVWELSHHGWDEQAQDAFDSLPRLDGARWYFIDGNHDETFWNQTGAYSGKLLEDYFTCRGRDDLTYLGPREGNFTLKLDGVRRPVAVQLWHPKPGKAYALSYQLQKRIEAFAPGTKPDILIAGHWHVCVYLETRGVHALAAGCFQSPLSSFAKSLAGGVSCGGWVLSWECTASGTMRRVAAERSAYFHREESRELELAAS